MKYKLSNGVELDIKGAGKKPLNTYLKIKASGYHGDDDYEVNRECKLYFNDSKVDFKDYICFLAYCSEGNEEYVFEMLKPEYKQFFKDKEDFQDMLQDWYDFRTDYSETHDETIFLDIDYVYSIDGVIYQDEDIELEVLDYEDDDC